MESFVTIATPIAIALVGFVLMWIIVRLISGQTDTTTSRKENPTEKLGGSQ